MFNRLTNQEWKILIEQSESSSLSKLEQLLSGFTIIGHKSLKINGLTMT